MEWFYVDIDGESKGPISIDQVKQLPLDIYVWNGCTVNKWTELKDIQSLIAKEAQQEYDCQYTDNSSDDDIVADNINEIQTSKNKHQKGLSLALLSQFCVNDSDEDTIDEELTPGPGPTILVYEPSQYVNPNANHAENYILNTEESNISMEISATSPIESATSPIVPSQALENRSLPKQCGYPPFHIIDKIPKGSPQIIAQPPSAEIRKKGAIQCPLCTFYNNIKAKRCSMCLTLFNYTHKNKEKHAENKNNFNAKYEKQMLTTEKIAKLVENEEKSNKNEDKDMDELNSKMQEVMAYLELNEHARSVIDKLPKYKKQQMIHQYMDMKEKKFDCDKNKKEKKKSLFKKKRTYSKSNKDWIYGFNPINIDDRPLPNAPTTSKSDKYSEIKNVTTNQEKNLDEIIRNNESDKIRNMEKIASANPLKMEEKEDALSAYDGYINKYGHMPQNATQLMKFSKMNNKFAPLLFKEARSILAMHKNKNTSKATAGNINLEEKNKKTPMCAWPIKKISI